LAERCCRRRKTCKLLCTPPHSRPLQTSSFTWVACRLCNLCAPAGKWAKLKLSHKRGRIRRSGPDFRTECSIFEDVLAHAIFMSTPGGILGQWAPRPGAHCDGLLCGGRRDAGVGGTWFC